MIKAALTILVSLLGLQASAQAQTTPNLIVNGNAERGIAGWTVYDGYSPFQAVDYGNNWVKPSEPGPANRGQKLFTGLGDRAAMYQSYDLGNLSNQTWNYDLSGWLGGWSSQQDNALLYVSFLDAREQEIGHASIGPVTAEERANQTGLFLRQTSGLVAPGTTHLLFSLSMERMGGGDNDGYADNLVFTLSAIPEPQQWAYLLAGLVGVGLLALRQRDQAA